MNIIKPLIKKVYDLYLENYTLIGEGRNRAVFKVSDTHVVKVPLSSFGIADNNYEDQEYNYATNGEEKERLAACIMFYEYDINLLFMEYVNVDPGIPKPEWADFIDCQQVGLNLNGKWVAYDYGYY